MNISFAKTSFRVICTLVCTLVCIMFICFVSAATDPSFSQTLKNNSTRIDIFPSKGDNLALDVKAEADITHPKYMQKGSGEGSLLKLPISHRWQTKTIELVSDKDGEVGFRLRAPDKKEVSVFVDYQNLSIDGKVISLTDMRIEYATSFTYFFSIKAGQPVKITVDVKKALLSPWKYNHINPYILFSFGVLLFVVFHKILGLLWARRSVRICDIFFLILFFTLLFVPMLQISDAEKSDQENRRLAKTPQFLHDGDVNNNFGKDFDQWFNDRFYGREWLINRYKQAKYSLISTYLITARGCANKQTKWLGNCSWDKKMFTPYKLQKAVHSINRLLKFTDKNDIKVYFLVAPSQGSLYGKNILPWYKNESEHERIYQMAEYLQRKLA